MKNENMLKSGTLYVLPEGMTASDVATAIKRFLVNEENMETQIFKLENESYFVQARAQCGKLKQFAGLDKVTAVKLTPVSDHNLIVEIGKGKWADKVCCSIVAWFYAWPLAVTTAIGSYKQGSLPRKVLNQIESFLVS
ncbi:MAG: hypothetical protein E7316_10340 [Clostridiales bacterium]|nr:hypothetical protein [Clostridiales bacterium]